MKELQPSASHCFVCGVENRFGLHIRFYDTAPDEVMAEISIPAQYQGYPGIVHGGIIAAMLDEVASRVYFRGEPPRVVVTGKLNVRYRKPVPVETPLRLVGRGVEDKGKICLAKGEVWSMAGELLAEADVTAFEVPMNFLEGYSPVSADDWRIYPEQTELERGEA